MVPTMLKEQAPDLSYGFNKLPMANASVPYHNAFWPDAVVMFKKSQNKAAAAKFLEYQFNKENRLAFAQQRGVIPERIDVGAGSGLRQQPTVAKFFVDQLKVSVNVYAAPFPHEEQAFQIRSAELAKAFLGEKSPKEAMDSAAEQIDTLNGVA